MATMHTLGGVLVDQTRGLSHLSRSSSCRDSCDGVGRHTVRRCPRSEYADLLVPFYLRSVSSVVLRASLTWGSHAHPRLINISWRATFCSVAALFQHTRGGDAGAGRRLVAVRQADVARAQACCLWSPTQTVLWSIRKGVRKLTVVEANARVSSPQHQGR